MSVLEAREAAGLAEQEAAQRLAAGGPNEVVLASMPAWRRLAQRFWGPLPWMLEATIILTAALGKDLEATIIGVLLIVNGLIGFCQQGRAATALSLLRQRLSVEARVLRSGRWRPVPARSLVVGDVVRLRAGDVVPADLQLLEGHVSLDQSSLTGESLAVDAGADGKAYSATAVTRGEATGVVVATGPSTLYGRTSQLVETASPPSQTEKVVLRIVRALVAIDVGLVVALLLFAVAAGTPVGDVLPFGLIILIASVPVALPTTFTVAEAGGALELSKHGVLVTRLPAVQESAGMDILCIDKTGTLTLNQLSLTDTVQYPPFDRDELLLLRLAAAASDEAGQDPIDLAVLRAVRALPALRAHGGSSLERIEFQPFDPSTKRTEAIVLRDGKEWRAVKGMPSVVAGLCDDVRPGFAEDVSRLCSSGARVLAVAASGPVGSGLEMAGLLAFADRPRPDSIELVSELGRLGVKVKMVTGDAAATAQAVAQQVGIAGDDVVAGVYPEGKFKLVEELQDSGHVVGMTGDGVNDAPALKQASVGIAVSSAVDVAKAAAGLVLTDAGLVDVVSAVRVSRVIHQRVLTWTLNKIIKTAQVAVFLTLSFFVTRSFVVTPFLIVLLLFANDFVTMSLAVDRAQPSSRPDRWRVDALVVVSLALAGVVVVESFVVLYLGRLVFGLSLHQQRTLIFVMLVFTGQATVYVVRERGHFWVSRPAGWLLSATLVDAVVVSALAVTGTWMAAISWPLVVTVLGLAVAFMLVMDPVKVMVLRRVGLT